MSLRPSIPGVPPAAVLPAIVLLLAAGLVPPAAAYTPGTGSLASENFNDNAADDWTNGDGISASPWSIVLYGAPGNRVWDADGSGPTPYSPTLHKAWRPIHPVPSTSWSTAFYYRADGGTNFAFRVDVEQRAPTSRVYRLQIDASGRLSLLRANGGAFELLAQTATGFVPFAADRWMRFAIADDGAGGQLVRARVWSGSATSEPSSWSLSAPDPLRTIERVHRLTFQNDGPKGKHTRIDDLEIWGDGSQGVVSSIKTIYICEWSHLDIGFTETPQVVEEFYKTTIDQVLANLRADPAYTWTIEEMWQLEKWWERSTAAEREDLVDFLRSGRLGLAAGYASLTVGHVGHEEFARTVYDAVRLGAREGFPVRSYIQDDVPGSPFSVPEMLAKSGVEFYFGGINNSFGGTLDHPNMAERPFWWQGPDGRKVLAWHTFDGYAEAFNYGFSFFDSFDTTYKNLGVKLPDNEAYGYPYDTLMIWRAFDNHYQGFFVRDRVNQWNATYATPKFVLARPEQFMDLMKARYGSRFPTFSGDYGPAWSPGTGNHDMQDVREGHRLVRSAEALGALADLMGAAPDPRGDIATSYRKILAWDEHSGGGSWPGYYNTQEMLDCVRYFQTLAGDCRTLPRSVLDAAAGGIAARVPSPGRDSLVVFNALVHQRDGWVRTVLPSDLFNSTFRLVDRAAGAEIAYQRLPATSEILFRASGLPSLGYRVYELAAGPPTVQPGGMLTVGGTSLENDFYRLTVDASDGSLSGLLWKAAGREMIDGGTGYRFNHAAHATNNNITYAVPPTADVDGSPVISVGETGPLMASLKVSRSTTPHRATEYRLYRGEDRVEIVNTLDRDRMPWMGGGTAMTYTVSLPFDIHNFELRTERTNRYYDPPRDYFPTSSHFAYHTAEHTIDFWDTGMGVTWACPETPVQDFERMASLESAIPLSKALLFPRLMSKSDEYQYDDDQYHPVDYEPGTSPLYDYHFHFRAHSPSFDPVSVSRFGFDLLSPLPVRLIRNQAGELPADAASYLACDDPAVNLYTLKRAEDGPGLVLRIAEIAGSPRTVRISSPFMTIGNPRLLSWTETPGDPLPADGPDGFLVALGPYETVTVGFDASFPISLSLARNEATGSVRLTWTGGFAPFTVERATRPDFADAAVIGAAIQERTFDDPVLQDGRSYYYKVR